MPTVKLHRFTLRARQRTVAGSTFTKGQSFTLPVGHPDVATYKADSAWVHNIVGAPAAPAPVPAASTAAISPEGQAAYRTVYTRLHDAAAHVERLTPEQRRELARQVHANKRNLLPLLVLVLAPAGPDFQAQLEAEQPMDLDDLEAELGLRRAPPSPPDTEAPVIDGAGAPAPTPPATDPASAVREAGAEVGLDVDADGEPFEEGAGDDTEGPGDDEADDEAPPTEAAPPAATPPADPKAVALAKLQGLLIEPGRTSMDELRALAREAGLPVTVEHDRLRARAPLLTALGELVAALAPAPPSSAPPATDPKAPPAPSELG